MVQYTPLLAIHWQVILAAMTLREANRFLCRVERAMGAAGAQVVEPFSQAFLELLVHEGLRCHHHLTALHFDLEVVTGGETKLIVDLSSPPLPRARGERAGPRGLSGAASGLAGGPARRFPRSRDASGFLPCLPHLHDTDSFTAIRLRSRGRA